MILVDYSREYRRRLDPSKEKEYNKACYNVFTNAIEQNEDLEKVAIREKVSIPTIRSRAKKYALEDLKMPPEDFQNKYTNRLLQKSKYFDRPYNQILLKLMNEEDKDKIITLLQESNLDMNRLKTQAFSFTIVYFPEQKDSLIDSLRKKIELFQTYEIENKKIIRQQEKEKQLSQQKDNLLPIAEKHIEKFLKENYQTKEEYCKKNQILLNFFDKMIEVVRERNQKLYQQYQDKIKTQNRQRYTILIKKVKKIIELIKTGIKYENGMIRDFDIIDYYQLIKTDSENLIKFCQNGILNTEELKIIKTFFKRNKENLKEKPIEIHRILTNHQEINCLKDKNGFPISGTGRVIQTEEKQQIINFLKFFHIPLNQKNYSIAFKRWLNGTIQIDMIQTKPKKI